MRYILGLLLSLLFSQLHGQNPNWLPLPDSNATWCAQRGFLVTGNPDAYHTYNYIQSISGDTLINGLFYHKVYESGILEIMTIPPTSWTSTYYSNQYVGCFRENNNRQAFTIPINYTGEILLYDFNMQLGDTVPSSYDIIISGIDSIYDGTSYRQRFKLSFADSSFWPSPLYYEHVSWIEGIGSTGGNFFSIGPYFEYGGKLYEFTSNGTIFYQDTITSCGLALFMNETGNTFNAKLYPNPFLNNIRIDIAPYLEGEIYFEVFNITGKTVFSLNLQDENNLIDLEHLNSGIYFYKIYEGSNILKSGKLIKQ